MPELSAPSPSTATFPAPTRSCIDLFMRELLASTRLPRPAPAPQRRIVHASASFIRATPPAAPTILLPPVSSGPAPPPTTDERQRQPGSTDRTARTRFCSNTHTTLKPACGDKRARACVNDLITPAAPGGRIREPELSLALAIRSYEHFRPEPLLDTASIFRHLPIPAILAQFDISDAYLTDGRPIAPTPPPAPAPSLVPLDTPETSIEALASWAGFNTKLASPASVSLPRRHQRPLATAETSSYSQFNTRLHRSHLAEVAGGYTALYTTVPSPVFYMP
jgi:hypothetical protein